MSLKAWQRAALEPPISPAIPIIDAHHHFWDQSLAAEIFGTFLPADLAAQQAAAGHEFITSVFMQGEWSYQPEGPEALRPVGETLAVARSGAVAGIVGHADFGLGAAVREVLEAHLAAAAKFRGVRHILASDPDLGLEFGVPPDWSRSAAFRAAFACLAPLDLSFDVWCVHPQLAHIIALAEAFPQTSIILDHLGSPMGAGRFARQRDEVFKDWHTSIKALARCPNVTVKLGGLGMLPCGFGWDRAAVPPDSAELAAAFQPYVLAVIEAFTPARCMFESNFPVDGLSYGYGAYWNACRRIAAQFTASEQRDLFNGTARRVYRLAV